MWYVPMRICSVKRLTNNSPSPISLLIFSLLNPKTTDIPTPRPCLTPHVTQLLRFSLLKDVHLEAMLSWHRNPLSHVAKTPAVPFPSSFIKIVNTRLFFYPSKTNSKYMSSFPSPIIKIVNTEYFLTIKNNLIST